jgi:hypothetical protein
MTDVREAILGRLVEVLGTIPALRSVHRNNVDITAEQLPAGIVFDADEETVSDPSSQKANRPLVVAMTPEIVIADATDEVGSGISALRVELLRAVLFDPELIALVGGNGRISYVACQTDVGWMRSLHGALRAQFTFKYALKPDDL